MNKTAVDFPLENLCFNRQKTVTQLAAATSCGTLAVILWKNRRKMKKYPKIKFPFELADISTSSPKLLLKPELPSLPIKAHFEKPKDLVDESSDSTSSALISILISGLGILLVNVGLKFGLVFMMGGGIMFFYYIFGWQSIENKRNRKKDQQLATIKEYSENIKNAEVYYKDHLFHYNNRKLSYENDCQNVEKRNLEMQSQVYIDSFRYSRIKRYLLQAKKPSQYKTELQKGVSHNFFRKYLSQKFSENVFDYYYLKSTFFKDLNYVADYVIYDQSLHLFIDIEIDEPYIGNDGTPIHFINSKDDDRDDFFLRNRWIVIRFAEIQIVQSPLECCELIEKVINNLKKSICNDISKEFNIEPIKNWSKEDSYKLGFMNYRKTYLPIELHEILQEENLEIDRNNINPKVNYFDGVDGLPF